VLRSMPRRLLILAAAALIPAVAGCEAGNDAPVLQFHYPTVGAGTVVQDISIRNVFVLGGPGTSNLPRGGSASLFLALINTGSPDQLLSIQAPGTATAVTVAGGTVRLPTGSQALLTGPRPAAVLTGLTRSLRSGSDITIVLNFAKAGSVRLQVPVLAQSQDYATFSAPPPTPSATPARRRGAPSPSASASVSAGTPTPTPSTTP
jgi:copper(I)-binding protein